MAVKVETLRTQRHSVPFSGRALTINAARERVESCGSIGDPRFCFGCAPFSRGIEVLVYDQWRRTMDTRSHLQYSRVGLIFSREVGLHQLTGGAAGTCPRANDAMKASRRSSMIPCDLRIVKRVSLTQPRLHSEAAAA